MALPLIPLAILAGLWWASTNDKNEAPKAAGVPAGPPGTPEASFDKAALDSITQIKTLPNGVSVRYWREPVRAQLLAMMGSFTAVAAGSAPGAGGPELFYTVQPGPPPAGSASVRDAAIMARGLGQAVLCTLWCVMPAGNYDRRLAIVSMADRGLAQVGQPWAILLDDQTPIPGQPPLLTPGPQVPGQPQQPGQQGQPQVPGLPQQPGAQNLPPGLANILANIPGGADILKQIPGFGQPQQPQVPGLPIGGLDPTMSPETAAVIAGMLTDPRMTPEALEEAAADAEKNGFPLAAAALRKRATDLRLAAQLQAAKVGGTPFVIRQNDTPIFLAKYYGGRTDDLLPVNPGMHKETRPSNTDPDKMITFFAPWEIGQQIVLPSKWNAAMKPPPPPAPGQPLKNVKAPPKKPAAPAPAPAPKGGDKEPKIDTGTPIVPGPFTPPTGV